MAAREQKIKVDDDATMHHQKNTVTITASKFYDLSHKISQEMPVYPGAPLPEFHPFLTIEKDKVNVTRIVMGSHTGTHVDAPKHFIPDADSVDKIPLDRFVGEAVVLDVSKGSGGTGRGVTDADLEDHSKLMRRKDILLLYTGTSDRWDAEGKGDIGTDFSYLEPSAAQWMVDHGIRCAGIDSLSVEKYGFQKGLAHEKLLSNGIGIIEGLNSTLKELAGKRMFLICLPLPFKGIDGSPVRPIIFDMAQQL